MSRSKLKSKWMRKRYGTSDRNLHRLDEVPKNRASRYITTHSSNYVERYQEAGSFGGHSIPKGGHRMVSGIVRANVKEEVRKQIEEEL